MNTPQHVMKWHITDRPTKTLREFIQEQVLPSYIHQVIITIYGDNINSDGVSIHYAREALIICDAK